MPPQVLLSYYTVPYDQVSFSDLNIYPYPRTIQGTSRLSIPVSCPASYSRIIKVQAGESIDLNARRLTSGDLESADLSPDLLRDDGIPISTDLKLSSIQIGSGSV